MKKIIYVFIVFVCCLPLSNFAQQAKDTLNYQDVNGKKQGPWRKVDAKGILQFEGTFKNDVPIGEFKKYHANGKLKYLMFYNPKNQNEVTVTMYDATGELAAKGFYYDKLKDSVWQYFGRQEKLLMQESYKKGKLDGKATIYWQVGNYLPAEIKYWKDSIKHGDWLWYYETGQMRMKAHYTNNKMDGDFIVYFYDGKVHINGKYVNDVRDGVWNYYNEDGTSRAVMVYKMGKLENEDQYEREQTKLINESQKNIPNYVEPSLTNSETTVSQPIPFDPEDPQNFINDPESYIYRSQLPQEQAPVEKKKKKKQKIQK